MYIPELKRELHGRQLDIWRGHDDDGNPIDMPAEKQEQYRSLWRRQAGLEVVRPRPGIGRPKAGCGCKGRSG